MPRKLILQMHISLDGKVYDADNGLSWATHDWDDALNEHITEIMDTVDHILIGRKLAEGFIPHWSSNPDLPGADRINGLPKTVISTALQQSSWAGTVEVASGKIEDVVNGLKAKNGRDVITYGGAETAQKLVGAGLVDELHLIVDPASVGEGGVSLFTTPADYQLVDVRAFDCGVSVAHYRPKW